MAAFLMACVLNGTTADEASALTRVLVASGETVDLAPVLARRDGPTIDKHSTGGVSDSTSLIVGPLLAAAGATIVKLSGRGLGHTGGTLDKLESVPGMRVDLSIDELRDVATSTGFVIAAQSDRLVPADRALYALRDVTATVPSTGLIASSVMSKKLVSGAETIVLDCKAGDGAFMPTAEAAVALADLCVRIGTAAGRRTVALVTAMDAPLGRAVGNALEVAEVIELLHAAPDAATPLVDVALALASEGLAAARAGAVGSGGGVEWGGGAEVPAVRRELERRWADGEALAALRATIAAQGGDPAVCDDPWERLEQAPVRRVVTAPAAGVVTAIPARAVGEIAARLGAGRAQKGDRVDPAVGLVLDVTVGERIDRGAPLATVHARTDDAAATAAQALAEIVMVGDVDVHPAPVVLDVRRGSGPAPA